MFPRHPFYRAALRGGQRQRRQQQPSRRQAALVATTTDTCEPRVLLAASTSVLSRALLPLAAASDSAEAAAMADEGFISFGGGEVTIRITGHDIDALTPKLEAAGLTVIGAVPELHILEGKIASNNLALLEDLKDDGLLGVIPVYKPQTAAGSRLNEATTIHETDRIIADLAAIGVDGSGISIGVLSDSYNTLGGEAAGIASGDLPNNVNVLQEFSQMGIDEGRAMIELIHDIAPAAAINFATAFEGAIGFADNIRNLARDPSSLADIIVDDIGYFTEPFFQQGVVAQAVTDVYENDGVAYFSSAGNAADFAYESTNINFVSDNIDGINGQFYDFDPGAGVDTRQLLNPLPAGQRVRFSLQWDDPFFTASGVDTDIDIFLVDQATGSIVASSEDDNIANQSPVEFLFHANNTGVTQNLELVIRNFGGGPNPGRLKYLDIDEIDVQEFDTNSPTVFGHPAAIGARAVAAAPFFNHSQPESFTSKGGTTILFEDDGTPLSSPDVRMTPHFTAVDGNQNTFFGEQNDFDSTGTKFHFFGTSAAAPNAAAIAVLMLDQNGLLTPDDIYDRLERSADDIGAPGFDDLTGAGLINAAKAIYLNAVPATLTGSGSSVSFFDGFEGDLGLSRNWDVDMVNGSARVRVVNNTAATGSNRLSLDAISDGNGGNSLNEAILHVDLENLTNVVLSYKNREFGDEDNPIPATFTGSFNGDGVSFSVDGTNWFRLESLTGLNSTSTYQTKTFNLSTAAANAGVTLGPRTQIKFQQFDNFGETLDGIGIDDVQITANRGSVPAPPVISSFPTSQQVVTNNTFVRFAATASVSNVSSFAGAKIRAVNFASTRQPGDEIRFRSGDGVSVSDQAIGGVIRVDGKIVGLIEGYNPNLIDVRLRDAATSSDVQRVIRSIGFRATQDGPDRTVRVFVQMPDGDRGTRDVAVNTVTTNTPASFSNFNATVTVDAGNNVFLAPNVNLSDPNGSYAGGLFRIIIFSSTVQPGDAIGFFSGGGLSLPSGVTPGGEVRVDGALVGIFAGATSTVANIELREEATRSRLERLARRVGFGSSQDGPNRTTRILIEESDGTTGSVTINVNTVMPPTAPPILDSVLPEADADIVSGAVLSSHTATPLTNLAGKKDDDSILPSVDDDLYWLTLDDVISRTGDALLV